MAGLGGGLGAGFGLNAGLDTDLYVNAHGGVGAGAPSVCGYPGHYGAPAASAGYATTGSILVLFILLVIITRSIRYA
ncbi:hypothetical protein DUZ99_14890 [Xylanibacillus composti]|uniref:Sporulation protein YjcZ n=1 Tax=Xylanibacillus composti TaxID=1572762 RepID=A0A8J4H6N4_9BACL|nr:hypothetical protein [Xylanibacillus composti]MDT9726266.1 hypothetical protein [Xylanibacillus composti]GIQ70705.1 hypothetical protein XYCOK13_35290 [Xylanibacillus composti]